MFIEYATTVEVYNSFLKYEEVKKTSAIKEFDNINNIIISLDFFDILKEKGFIAAQFINAFALKYGNYWIGKGELNDLSREASETIFVDLGLVEDFIEEYCNVSEDFAHKYTIYLLGIVCEIKGRTMQKAMASRIGNLFEGIEQGKNNICLKPIPREIRDFKIKEKNISKIENVLTH